MPYSSRILAPPPVPVTQPRVQNLAHSEGMRLAGWLGSSDRTSSSLLLILPATMHSLTSKLSQSKEDFAECFDNSEEDNVAASGRGREREHVLQLLVLYGQKSRSRTGEFDDYIGALHGHLLGQRTPPVRPIQRPFTHSRLRVMISYVASVEGFLFTTLAALEPWCAIATC